MRNYIHKSQDEQCAELIAVALDLFSRPPTEEFKRQDSLARLFSERQEKVPRVPSPEVKELDEAGRQVILAKLKKKLNGNGTR